MTKRSIRSKARVPSEMVLGSPWLESLDAARAGKTLTRDTGTDVAVVGAGIAGITTAYFLLTRTTKKVFLIEANRVAHGATGHNAGQLVSYFERPFADIVHEFGLELAAQGQRAVESGWDLLEGMRRDLHLETPCAIFEGYAGCTDREDILVHLRNSQKRLQAGLSIETMWVSESFAKKGVIPASLRKLYKTAPHHTILNLLETKDHRYVAALAGKKGCLNSAQFCEEALAVLLKRFPRRLSLVEHTSIKIIKLYREEAELCAEKYTITAKRVVLCTNGFERLQIENHVGSNIDTKFHHLVRGAVGYMAAFLEEPQLHPTAISYFPAHEKHAIGAYDSDPYYYLTRRPYGTDGTKSLICVGGPEILMDDTNGYSKDHSYPEEAKTAIRAFVRKTYRHTARTFSYSHLWHGLMGYTPNGIRCIGAEPCNEVLLYNLGCNGVGILPSFYGGFRISQIIQGEVLGPSIFDPADRRCVLPEKTYPPRQKTYGSLLTRLKRVMMVVTAIGILVMLGSCVYLLA